MKLSRLGRGEVIGVVSAALLVASLWMPWFSTSETNENSNVDGLRGDLPAWDVFPILRFLLLAAAIAPFVLAWIVIRGHALGWNRGEVTAIVGFTALLLVICNGIILGRPGQNPVDVSLSWGYLVAIAATIGITAAGILRQAESAGRRKPPGVG